MQTACVIGQCPHGLQVAGHALAKNLQKWEPQLVVEREKVLDSNQN
jgi:hypothetical protein